MALIKIFKRKTRCTRISRQTPITKPTLISTAKEVHVMQKTVNTMPQQSSQSVSKNTNVSTTQTLDDFEKEYLEFIENLKKKIEDEEK